MNTGSGHGDSLRRLIAGGRERLQAAGIPGDEAALDARLLAQDALGWDAAKLLMDIDAMAPADVAARYGRAIDRRAAREPLAYIVGAKEFWGLAIAVTPDVLIPRPESEFLIEALLQRLPKHDKVRVLDLCTGSGCLAVAIAYERRDCSVVATDISPAALAVARRNAEDHGVGPRVETVQGDLFAPVSGRFAAIVANPPYVPGRDRATLQPEVGVFEPSIALFGGDDGLDIIRRVIAGATDHLAPDGLLLFEFGFDQDRAVAELIWSNPALTMEPFVHDLQGIPRVAIARRNAMPAPV
jgi:release factor glutamine methyltransferase